MSHMAFQPQSLDQHLGQELRALRLSAGLDRRTLGARSGLGEKAIAALEQAEQPLTVGLAYEITKAMGVPPSRLFESLEQGRDKIPVMEPSGESDPFVDEEVLDLVRSYLAIGDACARRALRQLGACTAATYPIGWRVEPCAGP